MGLLTIAIGAVGREAGTGTSTIDQPDTEAQPTSSDVPLVAVVPSTGFQTAVLPPSIACGRIDRWTCRQLVLAGAGAVAGTSPVRANAYPSLVCGDDVDCPRSLLRDNTPAGSVVLTFGDGASAWVNVVVKETTSRFEDHTQRFIARVVRWFPPGA